MPPAGAKGVLTGQDMAGGGPRIRHSAERRLPRTGTVSGRRGMWTPGPDAFLPIAEDARRHRHRAMETCAARSSCTHVTGNMKTRLADPRGSLRRPAPHGTCRRGAACSRGICCRASRPDRGPSIRPSSAPARSTATKLGAKGAARERAMSRLRNGPGVGGERADDGAPHRETRADTVHLDVIRPLG